MSLWILFAVAYALGIVGTAIYLWHEGGTGLKSRALQGAAAIGWPVYLVVFRRQRFTSASESGYCLVMLLFPAYYIGRYWEACSGVGDCSWLIGKGLLWAPFWPAYIVLWLV